MSEAQAAPAAAPAAVAPTSAAPQNAASPMPAAPDAAVQSTPVVPAATSASEKLPSWTDNLNDDMREYVTNKGFQDPSSVLQSYRNLEKLRGVPEDRLLKVPEKEDSDDWGAIHKKLGKPDTADGYELKTMEGDETGFIDWAKQAFHGSNLTKKQANSLVENYNTYVQRVEAANTADHNTKMAAQEMDLKKDWGIAYHQNVGLAQRVTAEFGVTGEVVDAMEQSMGYAQTMKFFHNLGTKVGESRYVDGGPGVNPNAQLTPAQAQTKIKDLKSDPEFTKKYLAGDGPARAELSKLHQFAYPGKNHL